uniref:Uncharacterized protein n=1 Tax=Arundo donax TaxID=35708 RepID=A0A0A9D785_ARUDO
MVPSTKYNKQAQLLFFAIAPNRSPILLQLREPSVAQDRSIAQFTTGIANNNRGNAKNWKIKGVDRDRSAR